MRKKNLLTIKQFAQICRTTQRTIRFYEQKGLLVPRYIDPWTKYRYFDKEQAREFLRIKLVQNFHIPLKSVGKTLKDKSFLLTLDDQLKRVEEEIAEKQAEKKFLIQTKELLFDVPQTRKLMKIESFGPYHLFCMIVDPAHYHSVDSNIGDLLHEAKRLKLQCSEKVMTFYYEHDYKPLHTRVDVAVILKNKKIPKSLKLRENFFFSDFPRTKTLAYTYNGPHEYFILIYQKLYRYIDANKIKVQGKTFDLYLKHPVNTRSKYGFVSKLAFPVN